MDEIEPLRESQQERAWRAYQMRARGISWMEIALALGYSSVTVASRSVTNLMNAAADELTDDRKTDMINLELDRLDMMQSAIWDDAIGGDSQAINSVLKIMVHRANLAKLLGADTSSGSRTVIITSEDYIQRLKEVSD